MEGLADRWDFHFQRHHLSTESKGLFKEMDLELWLYKEEYQIHLFEKQRAIGIGVDWTWLFSRQKTGPECGLEFD